MGTMNETLAVAKEYTHSTRPQAARREAQPKSETRTKTEMLALAKVLLANPGMLRVRPGAGLFLAKYMRAFPVRRFGDNLILHSHLRPLNSTAYSRLVSHHLVKRSPGPSHAQIGVTNACPQDCEYCYNKGRAGRPLDTPIILQVIDDLRDAGVAWLGLTGGEPLLNPHLVKIVAYASRHMAVKLFTTGVGLTLRRARDLTKAGLFSVAVSLDHWDPARHDASRRYRGAFDAAFEAIAICKQVHGLHVSVSSVVGRESIRNGDVERLLSFLASLGVDEAWLSEVKPTSSDYWSEDLVITEADRHQLAELQDRYNRSVPRRNGMVVNYLGHFEGPEHFGCNAGNKMVYVDAFGDVSPCVFLPMSFGNVRARPLPEMLEEMRCHFRGQGCCFINRNYKLLAGAGALPLDRSDSLRVVQQVRFGPAAEFNRRMFKRTAA